MQRAAKHLASRFLRIYARCEFHPAMTPADLMRAGLEQLGRKWG